MKITPDPKAWKPWRRALRQRVKADPELRRARRRSPFHDHDNGIFKTGRFLIPLGIAAGAFTGFDHASTLGALVLWTLLVTIVRTIQVARIFHAPEELWLFYFWPLSDDSVFAHQRTLVLRASVWLGIDWLVFGLATAWNTSAVALAFAAPLLAFGQWAAALAIALFLGRTFPRLSFGWAIPPLCLAIFLSLRFGDQHNAFSPYLAHLWQAAHHATPGGALLHAWTLIREGNAFGWIALVLLAGSGFACVLIGARALRAAFNPAVLFDTPANPDADLDAEDYASSPTFSANSSGSPVFSDTELGHLRAIASAVLAKPAGHSFAQRGLIERSCLWFLGPRERVVVDYMLPGGQSWLRGWLIAAGLVMLAAIVRPWAPATALIPAAFGLLFALPLGGGRWHGFDTLRVFQSQTNVLAFSPLGFGEIARPLLKLNALRCVLAFPLVLAALGFAFVALSPANAPFPWALDYSLRITAAVLAFQPVCLIVKFSSNTNDSSASKLYLFPFVVLLIGGITAVVAFTVTLFMTENASTALICAGALLLLTHTTLLLYGWTWGRRFFDQMARLPK